MTAAVAPPPPTPNGPPAEGGPSTPAAADRPLDVPRDTTPTWELELLVSGAVLFGLFQLPPLLHAAATRWQPHVGILGIFAIAAVNILMAAAVYALIGCFVVHLAMRAYWVALVGVDSVFPGGVRWEKMREYGPIQAQLNRAAVRPLPRIISRVDNVASLVFATGFVLAASTLASVATVALCAVVVWAATAAFGPDAALWALGLLVVPLLVAMLGAQLVDYRAGARLDPAGAAAGAVRRVLRVALATSPRGVRSIGAVLTTNIERRVVLPVVFVAFAAAMGVAVLTSETEAEPLPGAGAYQYFADDAPAASLVAARYATLRGDEPAGTRAPWLDTDVVVGPYVRLFIPYRLQAHNSALAAACPGLRPLDVDDALAPAARAASAAVLACAARVHRVALDGRPLPGLRLRFFADPRANRRGFLAHVPVAGLAAGEHVLSVWPAVRAGRPPAKAPYELPFWR